MFSLSAIDPLSEFLSDIACSLCVQLAVSTVLRRLLCCSSFFFFFFFFFFLRDSVYCTARQCWSRGQFWRVSYNQSKFFGFEETSSYLSVQFFSASDWSSSTGKPRMTPVSFVKTTEFYEVSLVTIIWKNSYDSGILL